MSTNLNLLSMRKHSVDFKSKLRIYTLINHIEVIRTFGLYSITLLTILLGRTLYSYSTNFTFTLNIQFYFCEKALQPS